MGDGAVKGGGGFPDAPADARAWFTPGCDTLQYGLGASVSESPSCLVQAGFPFVGLHDNPYRFAQCRLQPLHC